MRQRLTLRAEALESGDHLRREPAQFIPVGRGEALHQFFALFREGEEDFPAVIRGDLADHGLAQDQLVDDADSAVMPDLQLLGQVADRELPMEGGSANGEQGMILVRSEVFGAKEVFAEAEEFPYLVTEGGESLEVHRI
jgi:hypothetical protein